LFSEILFDCSTARPRPRGVVGVFGAIGDFIGDFFGAVATFAVEIGVGRLVIFPAGAFSITVFDFDGPLLFPFVFVFSTPLVISTVFLASISGVSTFGTSFGCEFIFSSFAVVGVSTSGIDSSTTVPLFFLL